MIENADRFGLSQLHQAAGLAGRSEIKLLHLWSPTRKPETRQRPSALCKTLDGFAIAQADLSWGAGDLVHRRQHGLLGCAALAAAAGAAGGTGGGCGVFGRSCQPGRAGICATDGSIRRLFDNSAELFL